MGMTTDIERIARETGLAAMTSKDGNITFSAGVVVPRPLLARFAQLIAAECAKIADEADMRGDPPDIAIRSKFDAW